MSLAQRERAQLAAEVNDVRKSVAELQEAGSLSCTVMDQSSTASAAEMAGKRSFKTKAFREAERTASATAHSSLDGVRYEVQELSEAHTASAAGVY